MTFPNILDHVVLASNSLPDAVSYFEELTGVTPQRGGDHVTGTSNSLVTFTVNGEPSIHYLEIIGPNPARTEKLDNNVFGINTRTEPGLAGYSVRPESLDDFSVALKDAGVEPNQIGDLARETPEGDLLSWRIISGNHNGAVSPIPFSIDWGTTPHPSATTKPTVELVSLIARTPNPEKTRATLEQLGVDIVVEQADEPSLELVIDTPKGRITLS
ncbi:VOC family protein [Lysinibacter cavernae]|uniref:Glyoxalase-like domain-containing protein n=1 Tax=Lysinibacter cavernae TaxID=1640652 RepID=A0A7X5QYS9_9MICO|nr:VOC family protein [Lysinibacter cavernae]NIH52277.1 hypothetical protein [Lysinibacter cavernae]